MFKMGCSMAKRILAIDGKNSGSGQDASCSAQASSSSSSTGNKKSKDKQQQQHLQQPSGEAAAAKSRTSGEELNDFSKLEDDPRIPLNVRQIFKITKSWKAIARTMSKTGTAMFLNLFEQNQDLFYLFDRFQHLKGKELHDSMELREHAATVMSTLDHSINSLSDYDNFVAYLHSIGKLHRKVPGFKRDHFWKIEQPFLKAVKQTLDERCNETIEEIYKIAIKLIIETIAEGYGDEPDAPDAPGPGSGQRPASGDGQFGAKDNEQQRHNGGSGGDATSNEGKGSQSGNDNRGSGFARNHGGAQTTTTTTTTTTEHDGCPGELTNGARALTCSSPVASLAGLIKPGDIGAADGNGSGSSAGPTGRPQTNEGPLEGTIFALRELLALMVAKRSEKANNPSRRPAAAATALDAAPHGPDMRRAPVDIDKSGDGTMPATSSLAGRAGSCPSGSGLINYDHSGPAVQASKGSGGEQVVVDYRNLLTTGGGEKFYLASGGIGNGNSSNHHHHNPIPIHSIEEEQPNDKVAAAATRAHHEPTTTANNNNNNTTKLGEPIYGDAIAVGGGRVNKPISSRPVPLQAEPMAKSTAANRIGSPYSPPPPPEANSEIFHNNNNSPPFTSRACLSKVKLELNKRADCSSHKAIDGATGQRLSISDAPGHYFADCQLARETSGGRSDKSNATLDPIQPTPAAGHRQPRGCRRRSRWARIKQSAKSLDPNRKLAKSRTDIKNANECTTTTTKPEGAFTTPSATNREAQAKKLAWLSSDPEDLCELIKMLMLTMASRRRQVTSSSSKPETAPADGYQSTKIGMIC